MATGTVQQPSVKMTLLWTFSGTTFAAQTVSLDLSKYDAVFVRAIAEQGTVYPYIGTEQFIRIGETRRLICEAQFFEPGHSSNSYWLSRLVTTSTTGVTFENEISVQISSGAISNSNIYCLPVEIYGIKLG